jgi:hypothetical protein
MLMLRYFDFTDEVGRQNFPWLPFSCKGFKLKKDLPLLDFTIEKKFKGWQSGSSCNSSLRLEFKPNTAKKQTEKLTEREREANLKCSRS